RPPRTPLLEHQVDVISHAPSLAPSLSDERLESFLAMRYFILVLSNRRSTILLTTAIAPMLWGTTYVVTTELLPPHRPLLAALLRALPAGLLLVAITRVLPRGSWWWRSLVLGTLNIGAFNALLFVGAYRLPGGVAAT